MPEFACLGTRQRRERAGNPPSVRRRLLPRAERREQILDAATRAFVRAGYSATSLEDVANEAGVDRVILYRHFASKADLYRSVLKRANARLTAATGSPEFTDTSVSGFIRAAAEDPDGFRLLFRQAAREPEFQQEAAAQRRGMTAVTRRALAGTIADPAWARWASNLVPTVAVEAVIAWLDAGQPDPTKTSRRIQRAIEGVIEAARTT